MADKAWKQFERDVAALLGGRRFWANSGERLDIESDGAIAQCKLVKNLSLEALSQLAEEVERAAALKFKAGVVAVKVRRGRGKASPLLLVVTAETWRRMNGEATQQDRTIEGGRGMDEGLNLEAAGRMVGISPHTVRLYARRGMISYVRVGRRLIFRPEDLRQFIASRRVEARAAEELFG